MVWFLKNLFAVFAFALTEAWFLKGFFSGSPEFEPFIAFLAAAAVLICRDQLGNFFSQSNEKIQHDKDLYGLFVNTLPVVETEKFFSSLDFNNSFPRSSINGLNEFVAVWGSADKEFFNSRLEKQRKTLYKLACKLSSEIANRTVPVGSGENLSVFSDQLRTGSSIRPEFVLEDAKTINKCAEEFLKQYLAFVKICRSRLYSS